MSHVTGEFQGDPAMSFFGVFDGHGASGHLVRLLE